MTLATPELVLLDLDGTLVDTLPDIAACVNRTLTRLALPARPAAAIRGWIGNGLEQLLHRALTNAAEGQAEAGLHARARAEFTRLYRADVCNLSRCYPGVHEGLGALRRRNIQLGCVTNKAGQFVRPLLQKLKLLDAMSIIIAGDTLPKKKPDPLPLLHAAAALQKAPGQSLMVGDSATDVRAARAAGVPIVCVSYGYHRGRDIHETKPDAVIDSLAALPVLFKAA